MTTENSQLDVLLRQAETIDGDAAAQTPAGMQQQQEVAEAATLAEQNTKALKLIAEMAMPILGTIWPSLKNVWIPEKQDAAAGTLGPLFAKHGWSLKDVGAKYAEEIAAAAVCLPLAWASVMGVKADIAARGKPEKTVEHAVLSAAMEEANRTGSPAPVVLG